MQLYADGEPWKSCIEGCRLCRDTILNHLQMLTNVSFWLREQEEPLAEEVCGWLQKLKFENKIHRDGIY